MPGAPPYIRRRIHPFRLVRYACTFVKPAAIRRKKALLIAVGSAIGMSDLVGPGKDVQEVQKFLIAHCGYKSKDILVLTDRPGSKEDVRPTYINITDKVERFLDDQIERTSYFFYYSGHTAQQPSEGKEEEEEEDRKSECILPCDSKPLVVDGEESNGQYYENCILDSYLKEHLVDRLLPKSRLVAIMDSCHSGTLLNLKHHRCNRVYAMSALWRRALRRVLEPYHQRDRLFSLVSLLVPALIAERGPIKAKLVCHGLCPRTEWSHNVICISACKDNQQAFEAWDGFSLTRLIIQLLEKEPRPTLKRFMRRTTADFRALSKKLKKQWTGPGEFGPIAAPQVSSPLPLDMNRPLIL